MRIVPQAHSQCAACLLRCVQIPGCGPGKALAVLKSYSTPFRCGSFWRWRNEVSLRAVTHHLLAAPTPPDCFAPLARAKTNPECSPASSVQNLPGASPRSLRGRRPVALAIVQFALYHSRTAPVFIRTGANCSADDQFYLRKTAPESSYYA